MQFRLYADGTVVHEDNFEEYDNSDFGDDYSIHTVPDGTEDIHLWGGSVAQPIIDHIKEEQTAVKHSQINQHWFMPT